MFKFFSLSVLMSAALCANAYDNHGDKTGKHEATHSDKHGHHAALHTQGGYIRAMPPGAANTAAFLQMHNASGRDLILSDLHSPAAERVEIHRSEKQGDQMRMRKLENWTLKKDETAHFIEGGMHMMFIGLKKPLVEGQTVKLRLCFSDKVCQQIDLPVRSMLNEAPMNVDADGHSHH